jgi:endo-1,4-beta-xylanase
MIKFSRNRLISRRKALQVGIGSVTALAILSFSKLKVLSYLIYTLADRKKTKKDDLRSFAVVGKKSLKQRAKAKGLIYGAFPEGYYLNLREDPKLGSMFVRECALIVAPLLWSEIRPSVDTFDFQKVDYFAKFAAQHKLLLRGHPLVWYNAMPKWLPETLNSQNAEKILTNHLQTVVKRYAGKMHSWDVVNEVLELKGERSEVRQNIWLKFLGPDYVEFAFRTVAKYDPKALLVYNETDLEYSEAHQAAVLALLTRLKSKGTPIHALGVQSHLVGDKEFKPKPFKKFLKNVSNLGLKIMLTELDVIDEHLPQNVTKRDRIIAGIYEDYLTAILSEKSIVALISWGLSDRYTWLNEHIPRPDKAPSRPLPFDRDYQPKLAWNAIARAIDRAPKR